MATEQIWFDESLHSFIYSRLWKVAAKFTCKSNNIEWEYISGCSTRKAHGHFAVNLELKI